MKLKSFYLGLALAASAAFAFVGPPMFGFSPVEPMTVLMSLVTFGLVLGVGLLLFAASPRDIPLPLALFAGMAAFAVVLFSAFAIPWMAALVLPASLLALMLLGRYGRGGVRIIRTMAEIGRPGIFNSAPAGHPAPA